MVNGVMVCDETNNDERSLNTCVNRLIRDRLARPLRGSLLLVAKAKIGEEYFTVDIGTRDFPPALSRHAERLSKTDTADGENGGD